jgi:renalase
MRIGIVGAGIAGLSAARTLAAAGNEVVVFEGAGDVGGRCATRVVDDFVFDTGATSIAPRGRSLEPVLLHELDTSDLVLIEKPIYTHTALRVSPGESSKMKVARYTYREGNCKLPELLAKGLGVKTRHLVKGIEKVNGHFRVEKEDFEAVILCAPLPDTAAMLNEMGEPRALGHVHYRPCLSVLLGYDKEIPDINYHAIIDVEQRHPLTWLSIESVKSPGRAPDMQTAMVAQLSPQFTELHYETEDGAIVSATVEYIERLYGQAWSAPIAFDVKRWKYSQPENLASFDNINQPSNRLLVASDGLIGGRVEFAYEAGQRVAKMLMDNG